VNSWFGGESSVTTEEEKKKNDILEALDFLIDATKKK
jgi:hypothetical protein